MMNVHVIRKALTLARQVVWHSVIAHHELNRIKRLTSKAALEAALELEHRFSDCRAFVAIDRALKALSELERAEKEEP